FFPPFYFLEFVFLIDIKHYNAIFLAYLGPKKYFISSFLPSPKTQIVLNI
ncbi:MAG: hypothetical protein ACI9WM_001082, partial [Arenicella sp.]